jgi:hypothetical protein
LEKRAIIISVIVPFLKGDGILEDNMASITRRDMLKISAGTGLVALTPGFYSCRSSSANSDPRSPVVLRVPCGPTPVAQMGRIVYGYELYIGKALSQDLVVTRIDILADGVLVKTYEAAELSKCLVDKIDPFSDEEALFTGRDYSILFAWPELDALKPVPTQFSHRIYTSDRIIEEGGFAAVHTGPTLIAPPVKGDRWWAANGPSNFDLHHRRTIIDFAFKCNIAQRFATDWLQIGPDGFLFSGDGTKCTDYYCYGADLLAVADGTVIEARDKIPEGVPPNSYAGPTLQNVLGNSIVLDIGNSRYAVYAHIIPGTLTVDIGDTVLQGQVIGQLGNSGNSSGPHLHFHLCKGPDALASEGLPFSFASYDLQGSMSKEDVEAGKAWEASGLPQVRTAEMPVLDQVVKLY